jgi:carbon storage regulator
MLVVTRKVREAILIGDNIRVTVDSVSGGRIRIGIEAPKELKILREELAGVEKPEKKR